MNIDKKCIVGGLAPLLLCVGCSIPVTPSALRLEHPDAVTVCSSLSPDVAVERLKKAWERCYVGDGLSEVTIPIGGVPMTIPTANGGGRTHVEVEHSGDMQTLILRHPNGSIMMIADINPTNQCTAEVSARGWGGLWHSRGAAHTPLWLDDPEAPGGLGECK